ncbi:hypothetical protein ElyMa_000111400 [Elysia marginata]|uniref:BZIP domain-containing protein n=1 Tax=Elysia marginata TaxID=1093978 RepID=A0AAV4ELR2_9GAST|nr:hypothetical protein ElyMa_000111400 [Elysia marginata]
MTRLPLLFQLTDEEKVKRERRKAQNREAAKRCREKRKRKQINEAEASELTREKNQKLAAEVRMLKQRYDYLMRFLQEHISGGHCHLVDRHEDQDDLAGNTYNLEEEQIHGCQHVEMQQQRLTDLSDRECVPCKRQRPLATARTDDLQVIERVDLQPELADTVTISLPHNSLTVEEAPRIADILCPLSSEDVSAILSDGIDLNLSDPSSDTNSPVNPTTLFSSFSDHPASTSFISLQNLSGTNSPCSSSFAISDGTSGLGTSLSFSDNGLSANQTSSALTNTLSSFSATTSNDISTYQQSDLSHSDFQHSSSFNSSGHYSNENLSEFSQAKNDFSSSSVFPSSFTTSSSSEPSGAPPHSSETQQSVFQTTNELQIKTEDNESMMNWSTPIPQPAIDTLIAFLTSDASGSRPDCLTHVDIPKESPQGHSFSPITPQCSPATLSPASVCPEIPQLEQQNLITDRVSPSSIAVAKFEQITPRVTPAWVSNTPVSSACLDSRIYPPSDPNIKIMPIPSTPGSSTSTVAYGNMAPTRFRTGVRRASTNVSFPSAPFQALPSSTPHGYTTQLSSSSSSASSSTLSPPPSVPSPSPSSSHEVPESPSILVGATSYYDDGRGYGHRMSPMGAMVFAHPSSAHLEDISSDEE